MPRRYPVEFRRKVLDLIEAGKPVAEIAVLARCVGPDDLQLAEPGPDRPRAACWRVDGRVCRAGCCSEADPRPGDRARGHEACERVVEGADGPKRRWEVVAQVVSEGLPIEVTCRVVGVSVSGFYMWRKRKPSARAVRHAMVAEVIRQVHDESRQTYGARRVHAELVLGREMTVARCTVELIMRRLGLAGLPGRPRYRKFPNTPTAEDLVNRDFARTEPNRLWLTDITEHPTRRARCTARSCLNAFSRPWSVGRSTPRRPRTWSSTCSGWPSRTARPKVS